MRKLLAIATVLAVLTSCSSTPAEMTAEERAAAEQELVAEVHRFDGLVEGVEYLDGESITKLGYALCNMVQVGKDIDNSPAETRMQILQYSGGSTGTLDGMALSKIIALTAGVTICPEHVVYIAEMFT